MVTVSSVVARLGIWSKEESVKQGSGVIFDKYNWIKYTFT